MATEPICSGPEQNPYLYLDKVKIADGVEVTPGTVVYCIGSYDPYWSVKPEYGEIKELKVKQIIQIIHPNEPVIEERDYIVIYGVINKIDYMPGPENCFSTAQAALNNHYSEVENNIKRDLDYLRKTLVKNGDTDKRRQSFVATYF